MKGIHLMVLAGVIIAAQLAAAQGKDVTEGSLTFFVVHLVGLCAALVLFLIGLRKEI